MVGWALIWALDPSSREHDMAAAVRAATHEALMTQIQKEAEAVDITEDVRRAAGEAARALVGETLGRVPRRAILPPMAQQQEVSEPTHSDVAPEMIPSAMVPTPIKRGRNGHRAETDLPK
jgi:hypothetical protein